MTTADFLRSIPVAQRAMILDGITHVNSEFEKLAIVIRKLNGWIDAVDFEDIGQDEIKDFLRLASSLSENADLLTEQITINSLKSKRYSDSITKRLFKKQTQ